MPLPRLQGPEAEKGVPGGHRGRKGHRRPDPPQRHRRAGVGGAAGADGAAALDRRPDFEGDQVPPGLPPVRGPGLPDIEPGCRDPLRGREPAHPPGHADRLQPHGGPLYLG